MTDRPPLSDERLLAHLRDTYGQPFSAVAFLPLGADSDAAVFRVDAGFFLKLRRGGFDETPLRLTRFLADQGIDAVVPPLPTRDGALWSALDGWRLILYSFVEGSDAYARHLTPGQWTALGVALQRIHDTALPEPLQLAIPVETFTPRWRQDVRRYLTERTGKTHDDPISAELAALLDEQRVVIERLVDRAETLAGVVAGRAQESVLCHADLHAWNVLTGDDGVLYLVDWDEPIIAPRERDLMFVGAGIGGIWNRPEEEAWFYEGYGRVVIDRETLAYYRIERIVQDVAAYCEEIFLHQTSDESRRQGLRQLAGQFVPGSLIEIAQNTARP